MQKWYCVMLRLLVLGMALFVSSCMAFDGRVNYMREAIPSCVILDEDEYWPWRDSLSISPHIQSDLGVIYERFSFRYTSLSSNNNDPELLFIKAMCSRDIIYSAELARIMNAYGSNVSPRNFLAALSALFDKNQFKHGHYVISDKLFRATVDTVLMELESRFKD